MIDSSAVGGWGTTELIIYEYPSNLYQLGRGQGQAWGIIVIMSEGKWGHSWVRVSFIHGSQLKDSYSSPGSSWVRLTGLGCSKHSMLEAQELLAWEEKAWGPFPWRPSLPTPFWKTPALPDPSGPS